jgi:hypothetical protein
MFIAIANAIGVSGGFRTDGLVPINTVAPEISGIPLVGQLLSSTTGTWTSDTGVISFQYQWTRNNVDIVGATSEFYLVSTSDVATNLRCKVSATDLDGTSAFVNSNSLFETTVNDFKARVLADGGTFESESCLITQIQELI